MWNRALRELMPGICACEVNKNLYESLNNENCAPNCGMTYQNLDDDALRAEYEDALRGKDKLEDKAKITVMGVTVSVSLILGGNGLVSTILSKIGGLPFKLVIYSLVVASVIYMIRAGLLSLHMLMDENTVYQYDSTGNAESINRNRTAVASNRTMNVIRNNCIYASFACVRNSLYLLFVLFLVALIPVENHLPQTSSLASGSFFYTSESMRTIDEGVSQDYVEQLVNDRLNSGMVASSPVTIVDDVERLVVRFSVTGDVVNVFYIDRYV